MPYLKQNGVKIYYEVHGTGPVLLLSHGFAATSQMWQPQIEALSRSHTLILWDMRGHGQSDSPDAPGLYSEALCIDDMQALLDTAGADQAIIGGLSLGGYLSLGFYRCHPERCRALLLFDTGPGYRSDTARSGWNRFAERQAEKYLKRGLAALSGSDEVSQAQHQSANGLALAARGILTQQTAQVIDSLPAIEVPTLLLVGAQDEPYLAATEYMHRKISGSQKVILENAGHASNLHQPDAFNRAVLTFLESAASSTRPGGPGETGTRRV